MCAALSAKTTGASNGAPSDEWGEKTLETLLSSLPLPYLYATLLSEGGQGY